MTDPTSPLNILVALNRMEDHMPSLVGESIWALIDKEYHAKLNQLRECENSDEQNQLTDQLLDIFDSYPSVRGYLNKELAIQAIHQMQISNELNTFALPHGFAATDVFWASIYFPLHWTFDPETVPPLDTVRTRTVTISAGGIGGGKTVKFRNMKLDLSEFAEILSGAALAGYMVIEKQHILVMVAGVLLTIRAMTKAMTVEISEQEASVFWGMIRAALPMSTFTLHEAFGKTNDTRAEYGLAILTQQEFTYSVKVLEKLKIISQDTSKSDNWHIIESFEISSE